MPAIIKFLYINCNVAKADEILNSVYYTPMSI